MNNQVKYIVLALVFIGGLGQLSAQKMSRYHKNLLYEADLYFEQGDYYYASDLYTELCRAYPVDPNLLSKMGICYFHLPTMKDQSERFLELAVNKGDSDALYYLALKRIEAYKFYEAQDLLAQYEIQSDRSKSIAEIWQAKESAKLAISMVQTPVHVSIKNLGDKVNSGMHDYAPVWDSEGSKMYFTSRRRYDDLSEKDISEQYDENIFLVKLDADVLSAEGAPQPLNSRTNDAVVACSQNGKTLLVYRTRKNGYSGDLFISEKSNYGWGELQKLSDEINSKHQEASASFGNPEGTILYFSSDRPGGYGGKDLYVVNKLPDGEWSKPTNMGPGINSMYDEDAPFVAADGSLYFASNGLKSMGGYDIFCAVSDSGRWREPANMGYPINTPGDDIFFVMDASGKQAYFSSERPGGYGLQDIYQIVFEDLNTLIYKGKLVTLGEKIPPYATVTLLNDDKGTVEGLYQTNPKDGTFVLAINADQNYTVLVEADGFRSLEKQVFLQGDIDHMDDVVEQIILSK